MADLQGINCCGVRELVGVRQPVRTIIKEVCFSKFEDYDGFRYLLFEDTNSSIGGDRLQKYIKKYKLGQVVTMRKARNNNSGNMLKVYMWKLNFKTLKANYEKEIRTRRDRREAQYRVEPPYYLDNL